MQGPEVLIPITFFLSAAAVFILRGPVGKALGETIAARNRSADQPKAIPPEALDRLQAELDELRQHVGELEERQEFAERLLAQQRERATLGPGGT